MSDQTIQRIDFSLVPQTLVNMPRWCNWSFGRSPESRTLFQVPIQAVGNVQRANLVDPNTWSTFADAKEFCGSDRGLAFMCTDDLEQTHPEDLFNLLKVPGVLAFTVAEAVIEYHEGKKILLQERLEAHFGVAPPPVMAEVPDNTPLMVHILTSFADTPALLKESLEKFQPDIEHFMEPTAIGLLWQFAEPGYELHATVIDEYLHKRRISPSNKRRLKDMVADWGAYSEGTILTRAESIADYDLDPPIPPDYQHPDILAKTGVTVLAGRPKMGKSYLALNLALAIAEGGVFASHFDIQYPGAVLYMALEDHRSRMYSRLKALSADERLPRNFYIVYEANRMNISLVSQLSDWLEAKADEHPRLVVIDVFNHVQTQRRGQENIYDMEYRDMRQLGELANQYGLHIILVTHLNKAHTSVGDARDAVMSSTAITGGASGIWILRNEGKETVDAILSVSGKDIPMWDIAMRRIQLAGHMDFEALGDADAIGAKSLKLKLLIGLYQWDGAMPTRAELHQDIDPDYSRPSFYNLIKRMQKEGLIRLDGNRVGLTRQGASQASAEVALMPDEEGKD